MSAAEVQSYLNSEAFMRNYCYQSELLSLNSRWPQHIKAYCHYCRQSTEMAYRSLWSYNLREGLTCKKCGLNTRQRLMSYLIRQCVQDGFRIYLYEQRTRFFARIRDTLPQCELVGSEYLGESRAPGERVGKLIHEDAANLSFESDSFDIIVSQDVFEHVPDIDAAFREAFRVLKKGGILLLSVPFFWDKEKTEKCAVIEDGQVMILRSPVYHGNPMSRKGSLVYHNFGWDLADIIRNAGFSDAELYFYHSIPCGYIGINNVWTIIK